MMADMVNPERQASLALKLSGIVADMLCHLQRPDYSQKYGLADGQGACLEIRRRSVYHRVPSPPEHFYFLNHLVSRSPT